MSKSFNDIILVSFLNFSDVDHILGLVGLQLAPPLNQVHDRTSRHKVSDLERVLLEFFVVVDFSQRCYGVQV